jgi:hypothetical protein
MIPEQLLAEEDLAWGNGLLGWHINKHVSVLHFRTARGSIITHNQWIPIPGSHPYRPEIGSPT